MNPTVTKTPFWVGVLTFASFYGVKIFQNIWVMWFLGVDMYIIYIYIFTYIYIYICSCMYIVSYIYYVYITYCVVC